MPGSPLISTVASHSIEGDFLASFSILRLSEQLGLGVMYVRGVDMATGI